MFRAGSTNSNRKRLEDSANEKVLALAGRGWCRCARGGACVQVGDASGRARGWPPAYFAAGFACDRARRWSQPTRKLGPAVLSLRFVSWAEFEWFVAHWRDGLSLPRKFSTRLKVSPSAVQVRVEIFFRMAGPSERMQIWANSWLFSATAIVWISTVMTRRAID